MTLGQVDGRKRLLLFPPGASEYLKPEEKTHCLGEHGPFYAE